MDLGMPGSQDTVALDLTAVPAPVLQIQVLQVEQGLPVRLLRPLKAHLALVLVLEDRLVLVLVWVSSPPGQCGRA